MQRTAGRLQELASKGKIHLEYSDTLWSRAGHGTAGARHGSPLAERWRVPHKPCDRHGSEYPCTCAMGNVYRFVEPVVLLLLKKKHRSYGYELSGALQDHALTDAAVERAALYRTLRQLEANGNVVSEWETDRGGPARRLYSLTPEGERHLAEWAVVLEHLSHSMAGFVREARARQAAPRRRSGAHRTGRTRRALRS
jgi:PadR family transcriptional regulator, regulatory protein PadR